MKPFLTFIRTREFRFAKLELVNAKQQFESEDCCTSPAVVWFAPGSPVELVDFGDTNEFCAFASFATNVNDTGRGF
jgi:hypothetical protein